MNTEAQLDIFKGPRIDMNATRTPLARKTDPDSSKQAAKAIVSKAARRRAQLVLAVNKWPGCTPAELLEQIKRHDETDMDYTEVVRRLSDLGPKKSLSPVDNTRQPLRPGEARECSINGTNCRPWYPK